MDNGFPPLVHCDLGCGVVLVHPCIEFFDLSVLQFALEYAIIRVVCWKGRKTHYLGVIVIRGPESSDRLSIIRQCVVFICAQIKLLLLWTGACLPLSQAELAPPSLSYKPISPRPRDRGNISHDPTRDSSRDPFATHTSRDLSARDPRNL